MSTTRTKLFSIVRCQRCYTRYAMSSEHSRQSRATYCSKPSENPDIKPPGRLKSYIFYRYFNFIGKFTDTVGAQIQSNYPRVYKVYKLFKGGIYDFLSDTRTFYNVATDIWSGQHLSSFTRKQLEVYSQMPSDMLRSAPVIIAAPLPFVPYLLYPIAYMLPQKLLCRHFWTEEQRVEFAFLDLRSRLPHFPKILEYLQNKTPRIPDVGLKKVLLHDVLDQIDGGKRPELEALLATKPLFSSRPYSLEHLSSGPRRRIHHWHLARGLDLTVGQRGTLQDSKILYYMDRSLVKEGIDSLAMPELRECCFRRGLNARNLTAEEMREYLGLWTSLSSELDYSSLSLLLHAPVFFTYNMPANKLYFPKIVTDSS